MNVEYRYTDELNRFASQREADMVHRLVEVTPTVIWQLQKQFGGEIPSRIIVVFVAGYVGIKYLIKKDRVVQDRLWGECIFKDGAVWVFLSVYPNMNRIALHEYLHCLGHMKESFVRQAVKDFVNLNRLK